MPSLLASQLAKNVSLNAPLLSETARKKHFASSSYLFSASSKTQIDDLDTIYALAINAISQLKRIYPSISTFDEHSQVYRNLFSQRARETDRTLLTAAESKELNDSIKSLTRALGCCLMVDATGRVIEWLVRRFRVNEFNALDILALFLPYHESSHFAKMVSILTIDEKTSWTFLSAYKAAGKPLRRPELATEMLKEKELARFVIGLLPEALSEAKGLNLHRTLVSFNLSTLLELLTRADRKQLDAGTLAFLLPAVLEPLKTVTANATEGLTKECMLGSYVLLAALSQKCSFTADAVKATASTMVRSASVSGQVGASRLLTALISFMGPQEILDELPGSVVDDLVSLPDIMQAIENSLQWANFDKVIIPILKRTYNKRSESVYAALLDLLLTREGVPSEIETAIGKLLLKNTEDTTLLLSMYQRHPEALNAAVDELVSEGYGNKESFEGIITSLILHKHSSKEVFAAASNADASVRTEATRLLLEQYKQGMKMLDHGELSDLQDALRTRAQDSSPDVLNVLFSSADLVMPLFASEEALNTLAVSLSNLGSGSAARHVLRSHLTFFSGPFCENYPALSDVVLRTLVLPHVLFTKPRGRTAASVWAVMSGTALGSSTLLAGTFEIVEKLDGSLDHDVMSAVNIEIAEKLAVNMKASDNFAFYLDWIVEGLMTSDAHRQLLSSLISQSLISVLEGMNKIDTALRILNAIKATPMSSAEDEDIGDFETLAEAVSRSIVVKPSSQSTAQKMRLSLLSTIVTACSPQGISIDWFAEDTLAESGNLPFETRYLLLIQETYAVLNASSTSTKLVSRANSTLFGYLGSETLLFLAGIWTSPNSNTRHKANVVGYVALRHASAFLRAHVDGDSVVDFQTILPSLLVALQSKDRQIRSAAVECINVLAKVDEGRKPTMVYAYDQVYGNASADLKYMEWSDLYKYLQVLRSHVDHLTNDDGYLPVLHRDYLSYIKKQGKAEAKHKQRVLSTLLSHATCCPSVHIRVSLLRSLSKTSDSNKLHMLLPNLEEYVKARSRTGDKEEHPDIITLSLEAYDKSALKEIDDDGSKAWPTLVTLTELAYTNEGSSFLKDAISHVLNDTFFALLPMKRQSELALKLIELGNTSDGADEIKKILGGCVKDPHLISSILQIIRPQAGENVERAQKKPKTDTSHTDVEQNPLSKLSFYSEVLVSQELPGSVDLLSNLLETLSSLLNVLTLSKSDFIYVEQLLMSCMDSVATRIEKLPPRSSHMRLDVLVEVMRTSENPQTFQQALLLMASLARLSPESVLHNVMPIFTFMGSNVFHRDDSYSFKVIQKTTESIVPVAAASFREKYDNTLDRYIASRDLLKVFTDAFTHIPRHRRTSFFTHLVDVLDPAEFLAPVTMLLSDKMANRVPRQSERDAESSLSLPLSISQHYTLSRRISALKEVTAEAKRLARIVQNPSLTEKIFLDTDISHDGQTVPTSTMRRRQCQTLLTLIGLEMRKSSAGEDIQEQDVEIRAIIGDLLEIATTGDGPNQDVNEVAQTAQWALLRSMNVISVAYFSSTVLEILSNEDKKLQNGALDLLATRLPSMKPSAREAVSSDMAQIIDKIQVVLRQSIRDTNSMDVAIKALAGISSTSCQKEENALFATVPILIECFKAHPDKHQALSVVSALVLKLGPRFLPYLHSVVGTCIDTLTLVGTTQNGATVSESMHVLSCLLKTIPTFWGVADVKAALELYMHSKEVLSEQYQARLEKLFKSFAKRIPGKLLISSMMQCWPSIEIVTEPNGVQVFGRFFDLLKKCIHFSPKADITENLRSLFTNFLSSFDVRSKLSNDEASLLEDRLISSFNELIVKLNETVFTPLFRKLCDWAFSDETNSSRQLTLCRIYSSLLDLFKELMSPYMSMLINHFKDLLESYQKAEKTDKDLWLASLELLSRSLSVDDNVFWRDEKLRLLSGPLIQQVPICVNLKLTANKEILSGCLAALVDCLEDDSLLKAANSSLLMHTRSDDVRVRLLALQCAVAIWQAHGPKVRNFGHETATFILECGEDVNDDVISECRKLKSAVEAQVGKIDGL